VTWSIIHYQQNFTFQYFKARHGISSHVISGESAGVDRALIETGRKEAIRKMEAFAPNDVLNIDENIFRPGICESGSFLVQKIIGLVLAWDVTMVTGVGA
jgi:hypothetical protein